jgi:hypothetical protein
VVTFAIDDDPAAIAARVRESWKSSAPASLNRMFVFDTHVRIFRVEGALALRPRADHRGPTLILHFRESLTRVSGVPRTPHPARFSGSKWDSLHRKPTTYLIFTLRPRRENIKKGRRPDAMRRRCRRSLMKAEVDNNALLDECSPIPIWTRR